jgi:hypothetical protein
MFKCKHPYDYLLVQKEHTVTEEDDHYTITYHLYCVKCRTELNIVHAKLKR